MKNVSWRFCSLLWSFGIGQVNQARISVAKRVNLNILSDLNQLSSDDDDLETFPGQKCGFDKDDVLENTERQLSYEDPRSSFQDFGYARGMASSLLSLSRTVLYSRAFPLELTGEQAELLIYAQYGIIHAHVPAACLPKLTRLLSNDRSTWDEIKSKRSMLRILLKKEVPYGCVAMETELPEGMKAAKALQALNNGYWSIYAPLVNASTSVFAARSIDELRWKRGTGNRLRQIWHYGKTHMLLHTEVALRDSLLHAEAKSEKKSLEAQMYRLLMLQSMRNARLEGIEIDSYQNCISAQAHDVQHLIGAIKKYDSAKFRTVLLWREKFWKAFSTHPLKFLTHPLLSLRKAMERTADQWSRLGLFQRVGILLKPIATIAALAGVVLGVATSGQGSLGMLIGSMILDQGYAVAYTSSISTGFLSYLLARLLQKPIEVAGTAAASTGKGLVMFNQKLQSIVAYFENKEEIENIRENLNNEVSRIMDSLDLSSMAWQLPEDAHLDVGNISVDAMDLDEEVRRYVEGLVKGGFSDEVIPAIQDFVGKKLALVNDGFGWLRLSEWKSYGRHNSSTDLVNLRVRGPGIQGISKVLKVGGKSMFTTSSSTRELTLSEEREVQDAGLAIPRLPEYKVTLTREMKNAIFIEDISAYKMLHSSWLLWYDWTEYRDGDSSRALKGKRVYFDYNLRSCERVRKKGVRLNLLPLTPETSAREQAIVTSTTWKMFGGSRWITVQFRGNEFDFELSAAAKQCIRVHDPDAYSRFERDTPRRAAEGAWFNTPHPTFKGPLSTQSETDVKKSSDAAASWEDDGLQSHPIDFDASEDENDTVLLPTLESHPLRNLSASLQSHPLREEDWDDIYDDAVEFVPELAKAMGCAGQSGASSVNVGKEMIQQKYRVSSINLGAEEPQWLETGVESSSSDRSGKTLQPHQQVLMALRNEDAEVVKVAQAGFYESVNC